MKTGNLFVGLFVALMCFSAVARPSYTFYVAADGNDAWSGRRARPSFFKKDGPFATLPRALEASRTARRTAGAAGAEISIVLRGGTYFLKEPLRLLPEDSGLTLAGEGTISGGTLISNWFAGSINGRTALIASVPKGFVCHQLWVNGRRAVRARHPNTNYFRIAPLPDSTAAWQEGQTRLAWANGDVPDWKNIDPEAEFVVMSRWIESHLPIASLDPTNHIATFAKKSVFQMAKGDPYYIEGVMDALDATGEWFLDSRQNTLYYLPRQGEDPKTLKVIAPVLSQVVRFEGAPDKGALVSDITIKGLTFAHTEWNYPPSPGPSGSPQAAQSVPGGVYAAGLKNSSFQDCAFMHLGGYGLELGPGCSADRISGCEFSDLGGGGLKIGEPAIRPSQMQTSGIQVSDCQISDGGKIFHSAIGIWIGQSPNNILLHNEIHDFYYSGISIGWTWGYGPSLATNNLVASNHVHHIGIKSDGDGPILSDMGGIYTLGMQPGTRILNNLWHDIAGLNYGGWGIYFDEGSSSIVAASNIVYNTTHGGFHQHYGATNTVRNNIFAFSRDHQLQRSRAESHTSFFFETNIVVIDRGLFLGGNWTGGQFETDHNLYFDTRTGGETNKTFAGMTLEQFQQTGHDTNSVFANPEFRDLRGFDFRLNRNSPARHLGFQPIIPLKK